MMRVFKIKSSITDRSSISLEKYFSEVSRIGTLSPDKEVNLIQNYRSGDAKAHEILIKSNLRFVISVAKGYQNQGLSLEDLINEGNLGLLKAIERFDESKGFKFISYAVWWIRQSILQALGEHARMVRIPQQKVNRSIKVKNTIERFEQENYREPQISELEDLLCINAKEMQIIEIHNSKLLSLSESIDGQNDADSSITYENLLKTDESLESDYLVDEKSKNKLLQSVLNKLNSREQTILKASFGIGYTSPLNLEEIGEICGLTRERVRQLREKALERLRSAANKELLGLCL